MKFIVLATICYLIYSAAGYPEKDLKNANEIFLGVMRYKFKKHPYIFKNFFTPKCSRKDFEIVHMKNFHVEEIFNDKFVTAKIYSAEKVQIRHKNPSLCSNFAINCASISKTLKKDNN